MISAVAPPPLTDALFQLAPVAMWIYDEETLRFLSVNETAIAQYGFTRAEFLAMTILDIRPAEDRERLLRTLDALRRDEPVRSGGAGWRHVRSDGTIIEIEVANSQRILYEGRPAIVASVFDITERVRDAARVTADRTALEEAHRAGELGSFILDLREGRYRLYGRLVDVYGRSTLGVDEAPAEAARLVHPDDAPELERLFDALESLQPYEGEVRMQVAGEWRWLRGRTRLLRDGDGTAFAIVCVATDVTERKAEHERLTRIAFTDASTGLPNRAALFESELLPLGVRGALLLVRTDPGPNETKRAHVVRARNARAVAEVLKRLVPADALVARYSEKQFAIVLPARGRGTSPLALAKRIVRAFEAPLRAGDDEIVIVPSIGIGTSAVPATFPELARRAGTALAEVPRADGRIALYTPAMEAAQERRATLERRLRRAILDRAVGVVYQPVVSVASGLVVGSEALMRWDCPGLGPVPPSEFIAIAEESGVIVRLGEWILREACAQTRRWELAGLGRLRIAVNVSARQVQQRDFVRLVSAVCEQTGLDPRQLELEVTERLMLDRGLGVRNLEALRRRGVRVSVDDFGTGYSSLSCLSQIPLDVVKIDRSFVAPITDDPFQALVAENVIVLAHERGLHVVGEGVELAQQFAELRRMGCDDVQGYLFGRPMPAADLTALLRDQIGTKPPAISA